MVMNNVGNLHKTKSIRIIRETGKKSYGPYSFSFMRDEEGTKNECFLKGEVRFKRTAFITKPNGSLLMSIEPIAPPTNLKDKGLINGPKRFVHYGIRRRNTSIGCVAIGKYYRTMFLDGHGEQPYSIHVLDTEDPTDIAIFRNTSADSENLAKVHFPDPKPNQCSQPFEGTVTFFDEIGQPITEDEQELILSIIVAFMIDRNGPIATAPTYVLNYIMICVLVIAFFVCVAMLFSIRGKNIKRMQ